MAGGVGMYVDENITFIRRQDLEFTSKDFETCFIELLRNRHKNVLVGCIYRHSSGNCSTFQEFLCQKLNQINKLGLETLIVGDININLLNYCSDKITSEYCDTLLDLGFLPIITKATRITNHTATLIDHIYTNSPEKVIQSGICLADISDHLPCFCTIATKIPTHVQQKYYRDFSNFDDSSFTKDLNNIDFRNMINTDVNDSMNNIVNTLQTLSDKHAPIKKITNSKNKKLKYLYLIMGLKLNKSTIGIPTKCIKVACGHISEALAEVFNQSISQGIVPETLKISKVTPVHKGGATFDPANYRPISTLSCFTQIFEKLICKQLVNYIEKHQILNQFQFGFRKGKSTEQAII